VRTTSTPTPLGSIAKHWMVYNIENTSTTDRYAFDAMVTVG
jgi:hypothetical protein